MAYHDARLHGGGVADAITALHAAPSSLEWNLRVRAGRTGGSGGSWRTGRVGARPGGTRSGGRMQEVPHQEIGGDREGEKADRSSDEFRSLHLSFEIVHSRGRAGASSIR